MVTAVCQIVGSEPLDGGAGGKLGHLRYPAQPASSAYRPESDDIARIVLGELKNNPDRALDIATLANRPEVNVAVDGHYVVTRHLAVLAMTGAGKSWTVRRIIEQLAQKRYPIVIFDPHGDYTGLADLQNLRGRVNRYYAKFPVFDEPADRVRQVIESLSSYNLAKFQAEHFEDIFAAAKAFVSAPTQNWPNELSGYQTIFRIRTSPNMEFSRICTSSAISFKHWLRPERTVIKPHFSRLNNGQRSGSRSPGNRQIGLRGC